MTVVAEGIEAAEQLAALRDLHCEYSQGDLFGPSQPAAQLWNARR